VSRSRVLPAVLLSAVLCLALPVCAAQAASPATVTVRVVGAGPAYPTLLPTTTVTTSTAPVVKDGQPADACTGTSAAGALELATKGNWGGEWSSSFGYGVETIEGVSYPFTQPDYWTFWLNNKPSETGVCGAELDTGDSVLFFVNCYSEEVAGCPAAANPLSVAVPTSVNVGAPTSVLVTSYANETGVPSPAAGAIITGGGVDATTDPTGQATLTFPTAGQFTLHVSGAAGTPSVPAEASVCVHNGNDGTCGTTAPRGSSGTAVTPQVSSYTGPFAVVARMSGLSEGHVYPPGHGPRVLSGSVVGHSAISSVSLQLRRSYRGRCSSYDATRGRFVSARCGQGLSFSVASTGSFSYLLPASLARGRYVLDIHATDALGNRTTLARGTTRTVFRVG
jgi:hypothetical protein